MSVEKGTFDGVRTTSLATASDTSEEPQVRGQDASSTLIYSLL